MEHNKTKRTTAASRRLKQSHFDTRRPDKDTLRRVVGTRTSGTQRPDKDILRQVVGARTDGRLSAREIGYVPHKRRRLSFVPQEGKLFGEREGSRRPSTSSRGIPKERDSEDLDLPLDARFRTVQKGPIAGKLMTRREPPCDACRRRKSRCVIHEDALLCVLCEFHKQECTFTTFVQSPLPRKRKVIDTDKKNSLSITNKSDVEAQYFPIVEDSGSLENFDFDSYLPRLQQTENTFYHNVPPLKTSEHSGKSSVLARLESQQSFASTYLSPPREEKPEPGLGASSARSVSHGTNFIDTIEARQNRKPEIVQRCQQMNPPIPLSILQSMESSKNAIETPHPLNDHAWGLLQPRSLAELENARQTEKDEIVRFTKEVEELERDQEAQLDSVSETPNASHGQAQPDAVQQLPLGQRGFFRTQHERLVSAQMLLQQNPGIISTTDSKPFPSTSLNTNLLSSLPSDVKTWKALKQWVTQNPTLMPGVDINKLIMLQALNFQDVVGGPRGAPPLQGSMVPNQGSPRTSDWPLVDVSPQELQNFRAKLRGESVNITDDKLRELISAHKMRSREHLQLQIQRQRQQQQQQHRVRYPDQKNSSIMKNADMRFKSTVSEDLTIDPKLRHKQRFMALERGRGYKLGCPQRRIS